jgi:hypothetical protein
MISGPAIPSFLRAPVPRALVLNGGLVAGPELDAAQVLLLRALGERGYAVSTLVLRELTIAPCRGCFECWVRTPGRCGTRDGAADVARAFIGSDLVAFLTPVTFGGYSSELKKALDRIIGLLSPFFTRVQGEVHHRKRYARYPALVAIGLLPEPCAGEEEIFHALARRNAINMHAPACASRVLYGAAADATAAAAVAAALEEVAVQPVGAA